MPDTGSRQEGVQPYVWTLREFARERLLRFAFADGEDARRRSLCVITRVEQALERAARDGDQSDAGVDRATANGHRHRSAISWTCSTAQPRRR